MYRVRFIIAVLAVPGLVILVRWLLGLWLVPLLRIRRILRRVLTLVLVPGRRVLLWLLWLILRLNRWGAGRREHGMAGMAVLAVGGISRMTRGAIAGKGIPAVCAYPLSYQVLSAALRAGDC